MVAPLTGDKTVSVEFPTGVGVAVGVGVMAGVGVAVTVGVTVGVGIEPLLTVTAMDTVARTALLVEKALITNVCGPLVTVVVLKLILHAPPDGPHTFPLPVPSG